MSLIKIDKDGHRVGFEGKTIHLYDHIGREDNTKRLQTPLVAYWRGAKLTVKAGYRTDGTSIPRAAWPVVGHPWDRHLPAAIVHDILYETRFLPRTVSDRCFLDLLSVLPLPARRRWSLYSAVRAFGGPAYRATPAGQAAFVEKHYLEVDYEYA